MRHRRRRVRQHRPGRSVLVGVVVHGHHLLRVGARLVAHRLLLLLREITGAGRTWRGRRPRGVRSTPGIHASGHVLLVWLERREGVRRIVLLQLLRRDARWVLTILLTWLLLLLLLAIQPIGVVGGVFHCCRSTMRADSMLDSFFWFCFFGGAPEFDGVDGRGGFLYGDTFLTSRWG